MALLVSFFRVLVCSFSLGVLLVGCKSRQIQVNPGAYVTVDGTQDGLSHMQRDFESVSRTDDGIQVSLSSDVLFAINSSYLNEEAKQELDKFAKSLADADLSRAALVVVGHTDATGEASYNQWLSEQRAESVRNYLLSRGVQKDQITTRGRGQTEPIAPNNTSEGRKQNRRVDIIIVD